MDLTSHHICFAHHRLEVAETTTWPRRIATLVIALARPFGRLQVLAKVVGSQTSEFQGWAVTWP